MRCGRSILGIIFFLLVASCSVGGLEKQWGLAEEFEQQGQHLRAIEEYSRIVNMGHRNAMSLRAQMKIARIYEKGLKDYPRAIRAYRDAYMRAPDKRTKIESRKAIAEIYADKIQNSLAAAEEYEALYKELVEQQKEGPEVLLNWAKSLMEAGRFEDSAQKYEDFRKKYPGHREGPRTLIDEGQAFLALREPEKAKQVFQDFIQKFRGVEGYSSMVAEAYFGLGGSFEAMDDLAAALESYRASLATYPNPKVIQLKIERVEKRRKERRI